MVKCRGFGANGPSELLGPLEFSRREPDGLDVTIEILFCGVCHSDLHQVRDEWGGTVYPIVPGHEIVGRVSAVGENVSVVKVGDFAAVGCMVDSCRGCVSCGEGLEQYCLEGPTYTYNSRDRKDGGMMTMGGYSNCIVVDEAFVIRVPEGMDLARTAPLLCAGITTWSPLRHWGVGPGVKMGVVGLGGLGHMALKFGRAFGAEVFLFTRSEGKVEDARRLGADGVVLSTDEDAMGAQAGSFDFILDTVGSVHDLGPYVQMLKREGSLVMVGMPGEALAVNTGLLGMQRRSLAGSSIGGIAETREMLKYCGENGIYADIELIEMSQINDAYERMLKSDVKYRFVIDMRTL